MEDFLSRVNLPLSLEQLLDAVGAAYNLGEVEKFEVIPNGGIDAFAAGHKIWDLKEEAIKNHYDKIDWCDVILVVNHDKRGVAGYIGGNTLIEIGVAFYLKKKIYILNPVSSELSYKQEIMGMKPVFLNGNLSLIN